VESSEDQNKKNWNGKNKRKSRIKKKKERNRKRRSRRKKKKRRRIKSQKREDNGGEKGGRRVGDIKEEVAKSEKEAKRLVPVQFHKWIHVFGKKQSEKIHCQERKEKRYMSSSKNN